MSSRSGPVWVSSGLHLTAPSPEGGVLITDDLLRAWLMRAELHPIPESCEAERALHAALVEKPTRTVEAGEIERITDEDGRRNFRLFIEFRDRLVRAGTIESAYLDMFGDQPIALPPLFLDQMAHLIVAGLFERHLRDAGPLHARAAELFFREQRATIEDGVLVVADAETVGSHEDAGGAALFQMLAEAGTPQRAVTLDVLDESSDDYWARADRYDTALDMRTGQPAQDAFTDVLVAWIEHMLGVRVRVQAVPDISDSAWRWHVGLDAAGSALLDRLYSGEALSVTDSSRIAGLYRLDFEDQSAMREDVRGRPVHLALAMDDKRRIRMKPQNLLTNLPLAPRFGLRPDVPWRHDASEGGRP